MSVPKYGIVIWRDASGDKGKVRKDRATKQLPLREDIGWLFEDAEGTVTVLHNRILLPGRTNRYTDVEYTLVPLSWRVEIIPLLDTRDAGRPEAPKADA